ncbi:MAG: uncharacterized protein JWN93_138 [Hyphomicrobiales bacterium]|nr:uncharacterized protein [Hyphomicrobiales bacterium]
MGTARRPRKTFFTECIVKLRLEQGTPGNGMSATMTLFHPNGDYGSAQRREPVVDALTLVNPSSGIANDYLNLFNELVMLVEQLPTMPDLVDDLMAWRPVSYEDYFSRSSLSQSRSALDAYRGLDKAFRETFEEQVRELDHLATGSLAAIRRHLRINGDRQPQTLAALCAKHGLQLRAVLDKAVGLVNTGAHDSVDSAQARADRLLAVRLAAIRHVEEFETRPRFGERLLIDQED